MRQKEIDKLSGNKTKVRLIVSEGPTHHNTQRQEQSQNVLQYHTQQNKFTRNNTGPLLDNDDNNKSISNDNK